MALSSFPLVHAEAFGAQTATAGTAIYQFIPPHRKGIPRVFKLRYTSAGTAHTLQVLRSLGTSNVSKSQAVADTSLTLQSQPVPSRAVAANDYIAWENADGTWGWGQVSSVSGTGNLTLNLAANVGTIGGSGLPVAVNGPSGMVAPQNTVPAGGVQTLMNPGAKVWLLGASTDWTGLAFKPTVSADTTYTEDTAGVMCGRGKYEPLLIYSNNITAAGTLQETEVGYTAV